MGYPYEKLGHLPDILCRIPASMQLALCTTQACRKDMGLPTHSKIPCTTILRLLTIQRGCRHGEGVVMPLIWRCDSVMKRRPIRRQGRLRPICILKYNSCSPSRTLVPAQRKQRTKLKFAIIKSESLPENGRRRRSGRCLNPQALTSPQLTNILHTMSFTPPSSALIGQISNSNQYSNNHFANIRSVISQVVWWYVLPLHPPTNHEPQSTNMVSSNGST